MIPEGSRDTVKTDAENSALRHWNKLHNEIIKTEK